MFTITPTDPANYRLAKGQQFAIWHNNHPLGLTYANEEPVGWDMPTFVRHKCAQKDILEHAEEQTELYSIELLALAGIIPWDEVQVVTEDGDSGRAAIRKALAKLYPNMTVSFVGDVLRINSIPTSIPVESVQHTYIGLSGLHNHKKAVETITAVLQEKLDPLFGKRIIEESEVNEEKPKSRLSEEKVLREAKDALREIEGKGCKVVPAVDPGHNYTEG